MREMAPQDVYEGMLCSRLIALNNQTMYFMNKSANPDANTQTIDLNVNRVAKFTRLYNETLETLLRYRRKGEQKVTVQHVNVNNGGQAIVTGKLS